MKARSFTPLTLYNREIRTRHPLYMHIGGPQDVHGVGEWKIVAPAWNRTPTVTGAQQQEYLFIYMLN
jgi:hypothetical protein